MRHLLVCRERELKSSLYLVGTPDFVRRVLIHALLWVCIDRKCAVCRTKIDLVCFNSCILFLMTALFHCVLCAAFSKVTVVALREWFVIILVILFACTSLQQLHCRLVWFLFAADSGVARLEWARVQRFQKGPVVPLTGFVSWFVCSANNHSHILVRSG